MRSIAAVRHQVGGATALSIEGSDRPKWLDRFRVLGEPSRPRPAGVAAHSTEPQADVAARLRSEHGHGKPRLIIHAGVHRTGTTALQLAFSRNRPLLASHGVAYPVDVAAPPEGAGGRLLYHHHLAWALNERRISVGVVADWLKRAAAEAGGTVLLSSEEFARMQDLYFVEPLAKEFDIEAAFYLRRQDDWINSWYSQVVKDSHEGQINELPPLKFLEFIDRFHWIRYFDLLERWAAILGRDKIRVKVYEKSQVSTPASELYQYCCGVEMPKSIKIERSNESYNEVQVELLRRLRVNRREGKIKRDIWAAANRIANGGSKNHFPKSIRQLIYGYFRDQNEQVAQVYLGRADKNLFLDLDFPELSDDRPKLDPDVLVQFLRTFIEINRLGGERAKH